MKKKQRICTAFLSLVMLFTMVWVNSAVFANDGGLLENSSNTKEISNYEELKKALEDSSVNQIIIMQDIGINDTLEITSNVSFTANTSAAITRENGFDGPMVHVNRDASFTLGKGIVLDGKEIQITKPLEATGVLVEGNLSIDGGTVKNHISYDTDASAIAVKSGGKAIINNGDISNNIIDSSLNYGGAGVKVLSGGTLEMNGGEIHHNTSTSHGGGICVLNGGEFIFNDGKIYNNTVTYMSFYGGGIFCEAGSSYHMTGGEIYENEAKLGAGIGFGTPYDKDIPSQWVLEAGIIRNNHAIRVNDNIAYGIGGGINLPSEYAKLTLKNVYVSNNSADYGGGLYLCPTGIGKAYVSNGGIFADNKANVAGDLIYKVDSKTELFIGTRVLGGGKQEIYNDFNPRYQPGDNALNKTLFQNVTGQHLLHNEISESTNHLGKSDAKLFILDNTADTFGGGIAMNGELIIGDKETDKTLTVTKKWQIPEEEIPGSIKIDLNRKDSLGNEIVLETIELSNENNWTYTFEELPGEYSYTVKEHPIDGFVAEYQTQIQGNTINIEVINSIESIEKTVTKVWEDDNNKDNTRPSEISVQLYANDKPIGDVVKLSENNNWSYTWTNLMKFTDGIQINYSVKEVAVPDGYINTIEIDENGNFILTNTRILTPETPMQPSKPDEPLDSPKTGDTTNLIVPLLLLLPAFSVLLFIIIKRKKQRDV